MTITQQAADILAHPNVDAAQKLQIYTLLLSMPHANNSARTASRNEINRLCPTLPDGWRFDWVLNNIQSNPAYEDARRAYNVQQQNNQTQPPAQQQNNTTTTNNNSSSSTATNQARSGEETLESATENTLKRTHAKNVKVTNNLIQPGAFSEGAICNLGDNEITQIVGVSKDGEREYISLIVIVLECASLILLF